MPVVVVGVVAVVMYLHIVPVVMVEVVAVVRYLHTVVVAGVMVVVVMVLVLAGVTYPEIVVVVLVVIEILLVLSVEIYLLFDVQEGRLMILSLSLTTVSQGMLVVVLLTEQCDAQ